MRYLINNFFIAIFIFNFISCTNIFENSNNNKIYLAIFNLDLDGCEPNLMSKKFVFLNVCLPLYFDQLSPEQEKDIELLFLLSNSQKYEISKDKTLKKFNKIIAKKISTFYALISGSYNIPAVIDDIYYFKEIPSQKCKISNYKCIMEYIKNDKFYKKFIRKHYDCSNLDNRNPF